MGFELIFVFPRSRYDKKPILTHYIARIASAGLGHVRINPAHRNRSRWNSRAGRNNKKLRNSRSWSAKLALPTHDQGRQRQPPQRQPLSLICKLSSGMLDLYQMLKSAGTKYQIGSILFLGLAVLSIYQQKQYYHGALRPVP